MTYAEQTESIITDALPGAMLRGFAEDPDFSSTLALARVAGELRIGGAPALKLSCYFVSAPSRAAIRDLAGVASAEADTATDVVVSISALSDEKQQELRDLGLAFFDGAGNAWLEAPGLVVDRRGLKAMGGARPAQAAGAGTFSDKATIVSRALLAHSPLGVRELSALAAERGISVSPGFVSKVADGLEARRYARRTDKGITLMRPKALLDDWAEAYRAMRHPRPQGWYVHAASPEKLRDEVGRMVGDKGALAGLAAASLHDGHAMFDAVDVYARDADGLEAVLAEAGATHAERGANVNVSQPRYKASAFFDMQDFDGIPATSELQTYLDLHLQPRRGAEAAEHLYEAKLRKLVEPLEGGLP